MGQLSNLTQAHQYLEQAEQTHVLTFWDHLDDHERQLLLADLARVDWAALAHAQSVLASTANEALPDLSPPDVLTAPQTAAEQQAHDQARNLGIDLLRGNHVAALTVAGGQGTRLGFDGPKGLFRITPVRSKSLFQHFSESIQACEQRYGCHVLWCVMTSPENDQDTRAFFDDQAYFGRPADGVAFFSQGTMPALDQDGKILLAQPHRLALSPDGHGGTLRALSRSGLLDQLHDGGVRYISYFQVDNPLIHALDPTFIGLVATHRSEIGSKAIRKASDEERVGVFASIDGVLQVVEYSDLPETLASMRNEDGSRRFDFGNMAAHVFDVGFLQRLLANDTLGLPWHLASKKVPHVDLSSGHAVVPESANGIKLEQFIFDALPRAQRPIVYEVLREEQFAPVKNADGVDSPHTARNALVHRARCWLERCGHHPTIADAIVEISPLFAVDEHDLQQQSINADALTRQEIYLGD